MKDTTILSINDYKVFTDEWGNLNIKIDDIKEETKILNGERLIVEIVSTSHIILAKLPVYPTPSKSHT